MSASLLAELSPLDSPPAVAPQTQGRSPSNAVRWLVFAVLAAGFFAADQQWNVSLKENYADTVEVMELASSGGNFLRRAAFLVIGAVGCWLWLRPSNGAWRTQTWLFAAFAGYVAWAMLSATWSNDAGMTARRLIVFLCCACGALGVARQFNLSQLAWLIVALAGGFGLLGLAAELSLGTFRPWSSEHRFAGTVHPNTQGVYMACLCVAAFALVRHEPSRRWLWLVVAAGLAGLLLTRSRTSTAATLFAMALGYFATAPRTVKNGWLLFGGWLAALALLALLIFEPDFFRSMGDALLLGRKQQTDTLVGRTPIWEATWPYILQRPIFGFGYDSFWTAERIADVSQEAGWDVHRAHSAYIESLLSVGCVGTLLLVLAATGGLWLALRRGGLTGNPLYGMAAGLIAFGLLQGVLESEMVLPVFAPTIVGCVWLRLITRNEGESA